MVSTLKPSKKHMLIIASVFGVIGTVLLIRSFAATQSYTKEGESGQVVGPAVVIDDPTLASGDKYLSFQSSYNNTPTTNSLETIATGYDRPASIANAGTPTEPRLFVGLLGGYIDILNTNGTKAGNFLDISQVTGYGGERGLLGIAFHPNYAQNRQFFVYYTEMDGDLVISRFLRNATNPSRADRGSEQKLLTIPHSQYTNHNGGALFFDNAGLLYIATGDGGGSGANSANKNSQDKNSLLGKILRINVDSGNPYTPAAGNPFIGTDGADEIWAMGLRNPWRTTYDKATGDVYIADVGERKWEEVNVIKSTDPAGANFGWACVEGTEVYRTDAECATPPSGLISPVYKYDHSNSRCSITGGYVYRGTNYPKLIGQYVFADFCSAELQVLGRSPTAAWSVTANNSVGSSHVTSFGEDTNGELYASDVYTGTVFRFRSQ